MKRIVFLVSFLIGSFFLLKYISEWHNPINEDGFCDPQHCIYADKNYKSVTLSSMDNIFKVNYVENASPECMGAYFPAVHITTDVAHDKWILLMHNQGDKMHPMKINAYPDPKIFQGNNEAIEHGDKVLDDKIEQEAINVHSKFYSSEQDFFANLFTGYGLYWNRSFNVQNHTYAVQADLDKKTVRCIGGISWGYKRSWWNLRPSMIPLRALTHQDWKNDWLEISKRQFREYKDLTEE